MTELLTLLPYWVSLALSLGTAWYVWQRQKTVFGARTYAFVAVSNAGYTLGYILETVSAEPIVKVFWDNVQFVPMMTFATLMLLFAYQYVTNRNIPAWAWNLWMLPVLVVSIIVATDGLHTLLRDGYRIEFDGVFTALYYEFTPLVYLLALYVYLFALVTMGFLVRTIFNRKGLYRRQAIVLLVANIVPFIAGTLIFFDISLVGQRDNVPLGLATSNLIVVWGLFRYRLFNLVPIARDRVFESIRSSVLVLDNGLRVVDANAHAIALYGDNTPIIGRSFVDVLPMFAPLDVSTVATQLQSWQNRHYQMNVSPVNSDRSQRNMGYLVIVDDVTEATELQLAIQRQAEELKNKNEELEKAWEASKQADRVKSQFLASMSHELRTPLNAILNFTEFVAMGVLGEINERQKDVLEKSLSSGQHLLSLINDVLDMTKIEAGMLNLYVEETVNVAELMAEGAVTAETLLKGKPVTVTSDIDANLPLILADKRRIKQVLLNLISNACKFTEKGDITLSAKHQGEGVLIAVIDTGVGIAPEEQDLVFQPFQQTEHGVQHAHGTGLGLPISKRLVEAHHGKLWLESAIDEGAAFYVYLPVRSEALVQLIPQDGITYA